MSQKSAKVLPFVKRNVTRKADVVTAKREVRMLAMAA